MREIDHLLLQPIVEAYVGLDQVVMKLRRLLQLLRQLTAARQRHTAAVIDAIAVERSASRKYARTAADSRADRFFLLERFVSVRGGIPHRRDAVGEPDASELF